AGEVDVHAQPRAVDGHLDEAVRRHRPFGVDDVSCPVAAARREVAGQAEVGEGSERDVVGAADAALQHPAAPYRDAVGRAEVVDGARGGEPPYPSRFDVDDAAASEIGRASCRETWSCEGGAE